MTELSTTYGGSTLNIDLGASIVGGTSGSMLFIDASLQLAEDNANIFWDEPNKRLGIGTALPGSISSALVHIKKASGNSWLEVEASEVATKNSGTIYTNSNTSWTIGVKGSDSDKFYIGNQIGLSDAKVTIDTSGNVGIGTIGASSKLHVDSNAADTTPIVTLENTAGNVQIFRIDATPEASITGSIGDLAIDGTNGDFWIKETGTATNTGWKQMAKV